MKTKLLLAALALASLAGLAVSVKRAPQPPAFCDECVLRRDTDGWWLAGRWQVFTTSATQVTPVSELLAEHHACPAHEHRWTAPRHVAEADLETPDAPRIRSLGLLNSPRAVGFLRGVFEFTDATTVANWRTVAWQPDFASALEPALRFRRFPEGGFARRADFFAWWQEHSYPLFNRLHELTEAD